MSVTAGLRKLALSTHVSTSVGWLGAVGAFLALALAGLASTDAHAVRGAYAGAEIVTWYVIVPLAWAALATGLIQSAVSPWGLIRHYWVVIKLAVTVVCTVLLLVHARVVDHVAEAAARRVLLPADLRSLRTQLVVDAIAATAALVVATTLSIYKPFGPTPFVRGAGRPASWRGYAVLALLAALALLLVAHLAGGHRH